MKQILPSLLALLLATGAAAQTPTADKPQIRPGDKATYTVQLKADRKTVEDVIAVVAVEAGVVKTRHSRSDRPGDLDGTYLDDWRQIVSGTTGNRLEPAGNGFKFPLQVGNEWTEKMVLTTPTGGKSRIDFDARVSGYEKVRTPAGEFDAFKVEHTGWVNGISWTGAFKVVQTTWYAPAVGRMVRTEFKEYRRDGADNVLELKAFEPGK